MGEQPVPTSVRTSAEAARRWTAWTCCWSPTPTGTGSGTGPSRRFRARLVDTVDRVLDLLAVDPGWQFLLDGQAIVVEDYLARAARTPPASSRRRWRAAAWPSGPWYVQPDSLLPAGEAHVRNLLEGRRVAMSVGGCSRVAYTPDSFGHPAQFPALFAGFGLGPFVYWRGNGNELDRLGPIYRWVAPSGDAVTAYHLGRGYFAAACLPDDPEAAAEDLASGARSTGRGSSGRRPS